MPSRIEHVDAKAPPQPVLTGRRLRLRPTGESEIGFAIDLERNPENVDYVEQWSAGDHRHCLRSPDCTHWIIEELRVGDPVGFMVLEGHGDPNDSLLLRRLVIAHKGRGFGKEAVALLARYCFEVLELHRLWLTVLKGNEPARRLYRRLGFVTEGISRDSFKEGGHYLSMHVMSLLASEYPTTRACRDAHWRDGSGHVDPQGNKEEAPMSNNPVAPLEVGVLLGDPRLPYPYRREGRLSEEDFEDIRRLREALVPLDGFHFTYFDDHERFFDDLREAAPALVLNLCDTGYRNVAHHDTLVAALLEMLEIPFTGADSFGMGLSTDKAMVRTLAMGLGIPVPNETFVDLSADPLVLPDLYPTLIKPNAYDGSIGITYDCVVHDAAEALAYLERLRDELERPQALIQDFLSGTEYTVGLIGNPGDFTVLPPLEVDYSHLEPGLPPILSYGSKADPDSPYYKQIEYRRAELDDATYGRLVDNSVRLFQRLGCRDYARIDYRAGPDGEPRLLDFNYNPTWSWDGKMALMAGYAGYDYSTFWRMILGAAARRYGLAG